MMDPEEFVAIAAMELAETGSVRVHVGVGYDIQQLHNMATAVALAAGIDHINILGAGPEHVRIVIDGGAAMRVWRVVQLEARTWLIQRLHDLLDRLEG